MLNPPRILGAFVLFAATYLADASQNLFVASPNLLRVNSDEDVWVTLHDTPGTVKLYLENYPDRGRKFSQRSVSVGRDESKKVTMRVGWADIPQGSQQTYVYLVAECQALGFKKESVILLSKTSGYLFLQTDKPIYNPHETVNIRVVSLDSEMKPSDLEFTLDVINPNGDVIKRFGKKKATNGFVKVEFDLPKILVYGNWTLEASYKDILQPEVTKTSIGFEVKEYVLPTFSTQVKILDSYILESQDEIKYKVTTKYVFGTPVKGRGRVSFYLLSPSGIELQIGYQDMDVTGENIRAIGKDKFADKWFPPENTRFLIKVTVTEGATGKQESARDSSAVFVKSPFVISYERMPKFFRPSLPFSVKVDLTYPNKAVAAAISISIEALVTVGGRQQGAHGNQARSKDYQTDVNGRQHVTLDIPQNAADLRITVSTRKPGLADIEQKVEPITLMPHASGRNEFMVLQLRTIAEIKINQNLEIRADFTNDGAKKVNFMVVARGKILQHFIKSVNDRQTHENIPISPLMSPQARVIAYYVSGSEIISDSLVLDIVKSCGNELTITTGNRQEYAPKDNVKLTITAGKKSTVSVLGVDKAVYLLSEKDILTRSKMFKKMLEMDVGCGPGGGKDTSDVFKQAGLSVLVKTGLIAIPRRNTEGCPHNVFRRRRQVMETVAQILARLSAQDKVCCNQGVSDSVDAVRSCRDLTREYGSSRRSCSQAYLQCCEAEKRRVAGGRGRSGPEQDQVQQGSFDDVQVDIRKDFPETWINELTTLGPNEESFDLTRALPDSITTWVISGVSVSPDQGMCVAVPTNITSRKTFFVHVDLPYAAVRTEQLEVKATVYNLGNRDLSRVHVSLAADDSICYGAEPGKYTYRQEISLDAKSAKSVTFPIVPLKATERPSEIRVKALTQFAGDEVIKKIRVVNEGVKKYNTRSIRLDPEGIMGDAGSGAAGWEVDIDKAQKRQTVKIPLKFPVDTIPDTGKCSVSIHGNLLGPMVPSGDFDISKRIKLPAGCGEQNLISMAPLVYSTKYLLRTNKLTGKLESNAYDYITKGYESQLAYKKKDGSFAAWTYYPSSSWLTAMVTKVFCQASTFDQIGEKVREHVIDAVNWLFKNAQDRSGKFFETHVVIHKEMLGQTLMNDVTLTSFIVECIYRCKDVINLSSRDFAGPMRKAVQFIERNRQSRHVLGNPYGQAILTYALTLANSQHRFEENRLLWSMSNLDSVTGMRYWNLDGRQPDNHNVPDWYTKQPPAAAIETASYALLTQLAISGQESYFTNSGPIASWLIRQRTKSGSFSSTTDTVLGLEALSEYAYKASSRSNLNMQIRLYASGSNFGTQQNLGLNEANALIPILIEDNLPLGDKLNVEATGTGMAQLQVECTYHAPPKDDQGCPFTLEVDSTEYKATSADLGPLDAAPAKDLPDRSRFGFRRKRADDGGTSSFVTRIQSRIRFNGGQKVGMSMLEVSLFTGFEPYMEDLKKLKKDEKIAEYEVTESSVLFYLKEISSIEDTLVTFRATQKYKVGKTQPVAVKVYDYYEPNARQCTKFYHPHARSALLAQSCEDSQGRKVCACVAGTCAEYWGFDRAHVQGQRYRVKTRTVLYQDACNIYDYVVKVKAGQKFINKPLVEMQAEVENVIKLGSDNLDTGEKINFVWNSECVYPLMEDGVSYLVMGMDGKQYIDKNGRAKTKYILDSSSHVVQWHGPERRGYMEALNAFAGKLLREGCGQ